MTHSTSPLRLLRFPIVVLALVTLAWPGCGESVPDVEGIEVDLNSANFSQEVLQHDGVVFVDFWASWCGPCRQMEPAVAYLSKQYDGRVKVGKVNTDENGNLAAEYDIQGIPAFLMFRDGEVIGRRIGASSYSSLSGWVDEQLAE